ncbi:hypothetical protein ACIBFB_23000 [Nocardiopsis sp. NPDC050513]|uniref:hypothetical protein n=1 Tax=unclassified Nocardiopsis TaxID=2649073 RepID=UPI0022842AC1|nr:hypothetical protein [Nocardiopsis sp. EMB25]MCY9784661.1 hypothetical protein [Nocardiopsis sp. EMB25]
MARTRALERESLHGPWPSDHGSEQRLGQLRRTYPGWRFWRSRDEDQSAREWCAVRITTPASGRPQELTADTYDDLVQQLEAS